MIKHSAGKLIYSSQTHNHLIEVRENWRYRWLHFGGPSIQTVMKKRAPHALALPYLIPLFKGIELLKPDAREVTLLGVGGGAVVRYGQKVYPDWHITGVEIDPEIIEIATRYFALPSDDEQFTLYIADANDFLHHPPHLADIIISDIYSNELLPAALHQIEYYEMAYAHLAENGLLCVNIVYADETELLGVTTALRTVFGINTMCVPLKGYRNVIAFASKNPDFFTLLKNAHRNQLRDLRLDNLYGYIGQLP